MSEEQEGPISKIVKARKKENFDVVVFSPPKGFLSWEEFVDSLTQTGQSEIKSRVYLSQRGIVFDMLEERRRKKNTSKT